LADTVLTTAKKLVPMSQQFMPNINKKYLAVIMRPDKMKCDDTVLTQAILPLLFHWKSSKNKTQKK
jgi:hypothetical protein